MKCILKVYHNNELTNEITSEGENAQKELLTVYHAKVFENGNTKKTKMWKDQHGNIKAITEFLSRENDCNGYYYRYEYIFIE